MAGNINDALLLSAGSLVWGQYYFTLEHVLSVEFCGTPGRGNLVLLLSLGWSSHCMPQLVCEFEQSHLFQLIFLPISKVKNDKPFVETCLCNYQTERQEAE